MMKQEKEQQKEKRYTLAIKVKQIGSDIEPSDVKWGNRQDYFSSSRSDVTKFRDIEGSTYRAFTNCVTYSGLSKKVRATRIKESLDYAQIERLCSFPCRANSVGTRYFILTHGRKYGAYNRGHNKAVFKLNPYIENDNFYNNALVIDLTELKTLFADAKEEWKKEKDVQTYIASNEKNVKTILRKSNRLGNAVKEANEKLERMEKQDAKTIFTEEDFNNYNLSKDRDFLKRLGSSYNATFKETYVDSIYESWEKIDSSRRKIEIYQNFITNTYSDYMNDDFDIKINDLLRARSYIESFHSEDNEYPKMKNPHIYNREKSQYEIIGVNHLPNLTMYAQSVEELGKIRAKIVEQRHKMTVKMLLFLKPIGDVILWGKN